jgi:hypothetical protein
MTKKDYELIASLLRSSNLSEQALRKLVAEFAHKFEQTNPKFNWEDFARRALPAPKTLHEVPKGPDGIRRAPGARSAGQRPIDFQHFNSPEALGL